MSKPSRIAGLALLAGLAIFFAWQVFRSAEHEPSYQGKSLRLWLREYHKTWRQAGVEGAERDQAEHAIRQIGTNAIPTLLRMLRARDSAVMSKLQELDRPALLLKVKPSRAWLQNQEAAMAFEVLGADAKDAVPALIGIYEQSDSPRSRMATAMALAGIGPPARAAIPALLRAATNPDASMHPSALYGLMGIREEPSLTVPILVRCLGDTNRYVRAVAARGLADFGEEGRAVLVRLLSNEDADLRRNAANALKQIDAATAPRP